MKNILTLTHIFALTEKIVWQKTRVKTFLHWPRASPSSREFPTHNWPKPNFLSFFSLIIGILWERIDTLLNGPDDSRPYFSHSHGTNTEHMNVR